VAADRSREYRKSDRIARRTLCLEILDLSGTTLTLVGIKPVVAALPSSATLVFDFTRAAAFGMPSLSNVAELERS
jgi:hypothetical protein